MQQHAHVNRHAARHAMQADAKTTVAVGAVECVVTKGSEAMVAFAKGKGKSGSSQGVTCSENVTTRIDPASGLAGLRRL